MPSRGRMATIELAPGDSGGKPTFPGPKNCGGATGSGGERVER